MILICGIPSDPPVYQVAKAAGRAGIDRVVVSQREAHRHDILVHVAHGRATGFLWHQDEVHPLERFGGIFLRLMDWRNLPENHRTGDAAPDPERVKRSANFHDILAEWIEIADCRVMNRGRAAASNRSKPYQAQIIRNAGFRIPDTLVTNQPEQVRAFRERHSDVVYKSIGRVRSIVRMLGPGADGRLEAIRALPTQFQERIRGTDIRVHVAGDDLFATEVRTDALDYRYAGREGETVEMVPLDLPSPIAERCHRLAGMLELPLCGIDLKRTPDDEYVCFEVNPSPAFSYYQEQTGQPIADAVVSALTGGWGYTKTPNGEAAGVTEDG